MKNFVRLLILLISVSHCCAFFEISPYTRVNGKWSTWYAGTEQPCSPTCGAVRNRYINYYRKCNNPAPSVHGDYCQGSHKKQVMKGCQIIRCPIDGNWGLWETITREPCSVTCGDSPGRRNVVYFRRCDSPYSQYGGKECPGPDRKVPQETCHSKTKCPVNGGWSDWNVKDEGPCSVTCGSSGMKHVTKNRQCNNPEPKYGGKSCEGPDEEIFQEECIPSGGCPVDGGWSDWNVKDEGPCSVTCDGTGVKDITKNRQCNNPEPQYGGKSCEGLNEKTVEQECVVTAECPVDGGWSDWERKDEGPCSITCGGLGVKDITENRQCNNPEPKHGGKSCVGSNENTVQEECIVAEECPVNGGWGPWHQTEIGLCNVKCGNGTHVILHTRYCDNPAPSPTGRLCVGENTKFINESCFVTCKGERVNVTEGNLDWILLILGASLAVLLCITTMYAFRKRKRRKPLLKEGMESGVQQDNPGLSENA